MFSLVAFLAALGAEPSTTVRVEPGTDSGTVRVTATIPANVAKNLPNGAIPTTTGETLLVFGLATGDNGVSVPMLGSYHRNGITLTFTPRFALTRGEHYRAVVKSDGKTIASVEYTAPAKAEGKPAAVLAVYPTAEELPANQLKFYLHFSRPMREGPGIFDRIQLLDDRGEPVEDSWRRTELWSEDSTRLTLWIHPGRTKTGVNLRDEIGPVLEPKRRYRLVIPATLRDATGNTLAKGFTKSFRSIPAIREPIDIRQWKLTAPVVGTREPVMLRFPRSLDHALLARSLTIRDVNGTTISGSVSLGDNEQSWSFRPQKPWESGSYTVRVDERLEDLAGNTIRQPFDRDLDAPPVANPQFTLTFHPRPRD